MKYLLFFALLLAAFTLASTTPALAKSGKAEPAPVSPEDSTGSDGDENTPGSREETYEGNDRGGDDFDGGGYGDEGGMIGELFSTPVSTKLSSVKTVTEDRGSYIVVTTTRSIPEDACVLITLQKIDKKSGEVLGSSTVRSCEDQIL